MIEPGSFVAGMGALLLLELLTVLILEVIIQYRRRRSERPRSLGDFPVIFTDDTPSRKVERDFNQ